MAKRSEPDFLEVAERIDRGAVDAHLEVEVRAEAVPGAADVADYLPLGDLGAVPDREARLVAVRSREAAAVVDDDQVAVAALPASRDDRAGGGGADRRPVADADVDALVHPSPAPAE